MIALLVLSLTLIVGISRPGVLLSAVLFGYCITKISGVSVTTPTTLFALMAISVRHYAAGSEYTLNKLDLFFIATMAINFFSVFWAKDTAFAFSKSIDLIVNSSSIFFLSKIIVSFGNHEKRLNEIIISLCVLAMIFAPLLLQAGQVSGGRLRLEEGENVAVGLTQAFATSATAAMYLLFFNKNNNKKVSILALTALALSAYAISLTGTRGGLVAVAAAFITFLILKATYRKWSRPKLRKSHLTLIAFGILGAIKIDWANFFSSRIFNIASYGAETDLSSNIRMEQWSEATDLFLSSPIFGLGISSYNTITGLPYPHNLELELLINAGIVGLAIFVAFMLFGLNRGFHMRKRLNSETVNFCLTIVIVGLVQHQISFSFFVAKQIFLIGLLSGLLSSKTFRSPAHNKALTTKLSTRNIKGTLENETKKRFF